MVEEAQEWAVPAAAWVLTYLIHSTALIGAVWLMSRRLDRRPAALDALWKTALVGGLVTATLQTAAGVSPWGGRLVLMASAPDGPPAAARPEIRPGEGLQLQSSAPGFAGLLAPGSAPGGEETGQSAGQEKSSRAGAAAGGDASSDSRACSVAGSGSGGSTGSIVASGPGSERAPGTGSGPEAGSGTAARTGSDRVARTESGSGSKSVARKGSGQVSAASSAPATGAGSNRSPDPGLWLTAAFLAWAVMAAFLCLGLARSWLRLRRLLADRQAIDSGPPSTMLARLSAGFAQRRRIRLSVSPRVDVPIAVGILRPEIVVPERALRELQPAELESLLAHELAHLMRRDPTWRLIGGCIHRLLFLQPLNRVATANLENASEILCDDWAVERTERPLALARCLTVVAAWVATPLGASVPAMARHGSGLGRRVRRLVAAGDGAARRRRDRWPIPVAGGALALVVFAAPGATEMAGQRPAAPLPYASTKPASPDTGNEEKEKLAAGATRESAKPRAARTGDARRLLEELRAGKPGNHDLSDWVALAQLLGSSSRGDLAQPLHSGSGADQLLSGGGIPYFSPDDIEKLIEGALTQALTGNGLDVDFDIDVDFDVEGGIDVHIDGLDIPDRDPPDGDDDSLHFDFDFDFDFPDPPQPAAPPDPPAVPGPRESDCDDEDQDHQRDASRAARELRRHAMTAARLARDQMRRALEQARQAREQARIQVREQARALSRATEDQARRIRDDLAKHLRNADQMRQEAERQGRRLREELLRQLREQQREREGQFEGERERERERHRERELDSSWSASASRPLKKAACPICGVGGPPEFLTYVQYAPFSRPTASLRIWGSSHFSTAC